MDTNAAVGTAPAPVNTQPIKPAPAKVDNAINPTATRYGWCLFGAIDLYGGSSSVNLHVQPSKLLVGDQEVINPYHRILPAKQLIPFPTFDYITQLPSQDRRDAMGRAQLETMTSIMTALDAIVLVMQRYGHWGFSNLRVFEGMDQDKAFRIFTVVQPLQYSMRDMVNELSSGYEARRDATSPITILPATSDHPAYTIGPLIDDGERALADTLAAQMLDGADIAIGLGNSTLDDSENSIVRRLSGGVGKTGPDPLDRRLMLELGRTLPTVQTVHGGGNPTPDLTEIKESVNKLVDHAELQQLREENAAFRARENGATIPASEPVEETQELGEPETTNNGTCGFPKGNGEPCRTPTKNGERCSSHKDK